MGLLRPISEVPPSGSPHTPVQQSTFLIPSNPEAAEAARELLNLSVVPSLAVQESCPAPVPKEPRLVASRPHYAGSADLAITVAMKTVLSREKLQISSPALLSSESEPTSPVPMEQVQNIFGYKMLEYTLNLCQGCYDFLTRMPDNLIMHILSFLNADDIRQLSKTCKKFQQLCSSEELWERIRLLQDKHTHDLKIMRFPVYKKLMYFNQKPSHQKQMQRRQTTFF
ncbi:hypothetical protein KIL84_018275 [Mauremys mutica]|uniref:F-box domain-containing protein n=1 Tax=Mauremys mutica TaxID=74926 RepID=A0A9D3XU29_9SAUR|nr:hypothetical protein KIL84_018275 [Mauremys mutica]